MHVDRIWFAAPFFVVLTTLITSLQSGKILNPAMGFQPLIVERALNPGRYNVGIALRLVFALMTGWMAAETMFFTP